MAKSIRNLPSQSKIDAPALHSILLKKNRTNSDISQYFQIKKTKGSRAVPKPILDRHVIKALEKVMEDKSDEKVSIQIIIVCIEEFSSNAEVVEPWSLYHKEISQLLHDCLSYVITTKRNDVIQKTTTFKESLKLLSKFCYVLTYVADKSEKLSSALFNKCAEKMLTLLMLKDVNPDLHKVIFLAVSILCNYADQRSLSQVFTGLALRLKYVARSINDYPVETQMHIYNILSKSLITKEEAAEKAPVWFSKWPSVQDTFVECISKDFSEGCGRFLDKLYELKTRPTPHRVNQICSEKNSSTSHAGHYPIHNSDSMQKAKYTKTVELETPCSSMKSTAELPKGQMLNATPIDCENDNHDHKGANLKKFTTPYYPDRRKSLSLQKQKEGNKANLRDTNPTESKTNILKKGEAGEFVTPQINCFSLKSESTSTAKSLASQVKKDAKSMVQSPLSDLDGQEDHSTKVKRWLTDLSIKKQDDEELQGSEQLNDCSMKYHQENKRNRSQKRPSSAFPVEPKRRKEADSHTTTKSNSSHVQFDSSRGSLIRREKTDCRTAIEAPVKKMEEISVVYERSCVNQGSSTKVGKQILFSKLQDKEALKDISLDEREKKSPLLFKEVTSNINNKKHWEQKVKQLDNENMKKLQTQDIYAFRVSQVLDDPFKIPTSCAPKKKSLVHHSAKVPKTAKVGLINSIKPGSRNKENTCPKMLLKEPIQEQKNAAAQNMREIKNLKMASEQYKPRGLTNANLQNSKPLMTLSNNTVKSEGSKISTSWAYPKKEEVKQEFYSPCLDESMERAQQGISFCDEIQAMKQSSVDSTLSKEAMKLVTNHESNGAEKSVELPSSKLELPKPNTLNGRQLLNRDCPKPRRDSTPRSSINSFKRASKENANCNELDSGVDVTSPSEAQSISSKEGTSKNKINSSNQLYMQMRVRDYFQRATEANSKMSVNQNVVSSEILEIQALADKLSASVSRCQTASTANQQTLSEQSTALEGCSNYLGPYEDQSFKASVPSTKFIDYKEFSRQIRAKNTERVMNALKSVMAEDLSSSSDSE